MRVEINHRCSDFDSYRSARVKSLFNVESGCNFSLAADLPVDAGDWQIGLVVGPSGSGKSSLGAAFWGADKVYAPAWPADAPIVDAIAPGGAFNEVTGALSAVGLGSVPAWLRPYPVLSNGERFRADLARLLAEAGSDLRPTDAELRFPNAAGRRQVVVDEFTSVVDRQIAKVGALAFGKAWRRTGGQAVLLSCHYDVVEWLAPDWVFDTATGQFQRGLLRRRPPIHVDLWETDWRYWPAFEPHHYLKLPKMIAATNYVAAVDGQLVAHVAFSTRPGFREARACRLVVMPEWQGAGVGLRFLDACCERWLQGQNRYSKAMPSLFHTSHPGLAEALRKRRGWTQVSARLHGDHRGRSVASINRYSKANGGVVHGNAGYGGHFRAVQGFRYVGAENPV